MKATKRFLAGVLAMSLLFSNMSTVAYAVDEVPAAPEAAETVFETGPSEEELAAQAAEQAAAEEAARVAAEQAAAEEAARVAAEQAAAEEAARVAAEQAAAEEAARQAAEQAAAEEAAAEEAARVAAEQAAAEEAARQAAEQAAAEEPAVVEEPAAAQSITAPQAAMAAPDTGMTPGILGPAILPVPEEETAAEPEDETAAPEEAPEETPVVAQMELVSGAGVTVSAMLPEGTTLTVQAGNAAEAAAAIGEGAQVLQVWDITLTNAEGGDAELQGDAAVTVPLAPEQDAAVYYIHNGTADKVADLPAGQRTFTVSHFSTYAIAALPEETGDEDEAGDGIDTGLLPELGEPIVAVPEEEAAAEEEVEEEAAEDNGTATAAQDDYGIMPISTSSYNYPFGIEATNNSNHRGFKGDGYLFVDDSFRLLGTGDGLTNHKWVYDPEGVLSHKEDDDGFSIFWSENEDINSEGTALEQGKVTVTHTTSLSSYQSTCTITVFEQRKVNYETDGHGSVSQASEIYAYNADDPTIPDNWAKNMETRGVKPAPEGAVATPAEGYELDYWELNGKNIGKDLTTETIRAADNGATFKAIFKEIKKNATITITPYNGPYDGAEHKATVTVTDATTGELLTEGTGYTVNYAPESVIDAGEYTVTVTGLGAYSENTTSQIFNIAKKSATVSSGDVSKVYDGEPYDHGGETISQEGFVEGQGVTLSSWTTASYITPSEYENSFEYTANANTNLNNYTIDPKFGTLTISPAAAERTFDITKPDDTIYNGKPQPMEPTVTDKNTGKPLVKDIDYTVHWNTEDFTNAGTKLCTVSGKGNYTGWRMLLYTIDPAEVTVQGTVNDEAKKSIVYGTGDKAPAYGVTVTGIYSGDGYDSTITVTNEAGDEVLQEAWPLDVGTYTVVPGITIDAAKAANYTIKEPQSGTLTVTQAEAEVTITGHSDSGTYTGEEQSVSGYEIKGLIEGQMTLTGPTQEEFKITGTDAGTYFTEMANQFAVESTNYDVKLTVNEGKLEIGKAPLTLTPQNDTVTYDGNAHADTVKVEGLVEKDKANVTVAAPTFTDADEHHYTLDANNISWGNAEPKNYQVTDFGSGTLTIAPAPVTVTADSKTAVYGQPLPELTAQVGGKPANGDPVNYSVSYAAAETPRDIGEYEIAVTAGANPNYTVTTANAVLTITPAAVVVTANSLRKEYGEADPALTATVTGVVPGESVAYSTPTRAAGENVGSYPITVTGAAEQGNYTVTFVGGTFTVERASATVTVHSAIKRQGEADPQFAVDVSGVVAGDTLAYNITREPGDYRVYAQVGSNPNYSVDTVDAVLDILPAAAVIAEAAPIEPAAPAAPTAPAGTAGRAGLLTPAAPGAVIDDDAAPLAAAPAEDEGEAVEIGEDETPLAPAPEDEAVTVEEDETPLASAPLDAAADCRELPHLMWSLLLLAAVVAGTYANKRRQANRFSRG